METSIVGILITFDTLLPFASSLPLPIPGELPTKAIESKLSSENNESVTADCTWSAGNGAHPFTVNPNGINSSFVGQECEIALSIGGNSTLTPRIPQEDLYLLS